MRRLLSLLLAALMLLATAACGGGDSDKPESDVDMGQEIKGLSVSGNFGEEPEVKVDPAVKVDKPTTQVVSAGEGNPVVANQDAMFNIFLAKGADGEKLYSSADQGTPTQAKMTEGQFFKVIIDGLVGKPQGSRVAIAATVKDVWGQAGAPQLKLKTSDTVMFVIDVLSVTPKEVIDGPEGEEVAPPADAPAVTESGGEVTGVDFSKAAKKAPTELQTIPLIKGDGPVVRDQSLVTVDYIGQVYGSSKPFNNSYASEPATFGVGKGSSVIPAWNKALVGLPRGSRVLLVVPPADGYGPGGNPAIKVGPKDAMVFLVDVLGVDG